MKLFRNLFFLIVLHAIQIEALPSDTKLKNLYNSLDPSSLSQHLAFYELYSTSSWGQKALQDVWQLLAGKSSSSVTIKPIISLSPAIIHTMVSMVNKPIDQELIILEDSALEIFDTLSKRLAHYNLKGHDVWSESEVLNLPLEEIDVARGLFISQFGEDRKKIRSYETMLDLIAVQILARLPPSPTPEDKIKAINAFIFDEMGFRFPPHSLSTKNIDVYTFLPSVLDSRRGVCLGVSILYLCIAQRLALAIEMITPPGHIFVRYRAGEHIINIETTARGIHLDSEDYLSVSTRSLQQRTIREVIGMAHFNQASVFWQQGDYDQTLKAYQKAEPYMKGDPTLKELMGYALILTGKKNEGERLVAEIKDHCPDYAIVKNTMAEDYFLGHADADAIKVIFAKVDEDRQSLLNKKEILEQTLKRCPYFRSAILNLAITWIQLHRASEALEVLEYYQKIDPNDPEVHYYLAVLYEMRRDFPHAWHHLQIAEKIVKSHNHDPEDLKDLRQELIQSCPE